jgi:hypothetical protein
VFTAVPELAQGDFATPGNLADHFRRGGAPVTRPLMRALGRAAEAAQCARNSEQALRPAIVMLVDQLEELFAQTVSIDERAAFVAC